MALSLLLALAPAAPLQGATPVPPLQRVHPTPQVPPGLAYVPAMDGFGELLLDGGDTELELADTNGDGHVDLLSIGDHGSPFVNTQQHGITTWFGDGRGVWTLFQNGSFGYGGIAVGDVNGDGLPDVGYGMHHDYSADDFGDQLVEVALGDGTGLAWTPWDDGLATDGETYGMFATDFADVDGDGRLDVASNSFGCCAGVHVYRNEGDGTWTPTFGFLGGNADPVLLFGELDGDGNADLVAANDQGNVWLGDGGGGFVLADGDLPGAASGRRGLDLGDVDGDGRDDLAFWLGGGLQVRGLVAGTSTSWEDKSAGLPRSGLATAFVQLDDMDADGALDLVATAGGQVIVWRGDGAGTWSFAASLTVQSGASAVTLRTGDIDHNGRPDVAWVQDESCGLFCSRNRLYLVAETSAPTSLAARVTVPHGGEVWRAGSVRFVEWLAAVPSSAPGWPGAVRVELSTSGPSGPWTPLAKNEPNDGSLQLVVPPGAVSDDCRVRVSVRAGDETVQAIGGTFRIVP